MAFCGEIIGKMENTHTHVFQELAYVVVRFGKPDA